MKSITRPKKTLPQPSPVSLRPFRRKSAFLFAACLGLWLPRSYSEILVDLDATGLAEGPLPTWSNKGKTPGDFTSAGPVVPQVKSVQGAKGVSFLGGTTGTAGTHYLGPSAPEAVTGSNARTIEAWVLNPSPQAEEAVFAWGRRGGPDGSNVSFGHGTDPTFGAVGHWGAPDIGWNGHIAFGRWTYIAYTYDGITAKVYEDGELANNEDVALDTWAFDNTAAGNPLPFRVARQNVAAGTPSGVGVGEITIAKIRVHDTALDEAAIKAKFDQEKTVFSLGDSDNDGLPDWFEKQFSFLNPNDAADAAKDQDGDGLTNLQEFQKGTAPDKADTDGDGISDGAEVNRTAAGQPAPTDPLKKDTDGDGLSDKVETGTGVFASANDTGSDPLKADTDGDGFSDFQEAISNSDPNKASSTPGPDRPAMVALDASALPAGALSQWPNSGTLGGLFAAPANAAGNVETVQGVKGVRLNGTSNYYTGPAAPSFITGNASRTIEAWIFNPTAADEETIFSWGRRGGPDGSNTSFNHGLNAAFGAVGHWGAPDIGWNGQIATGQWTYVVYTYDGPNQTTVVYKDGVEANRETLTAPLNTWAVDNAPAANPLPFRVGSQNEANGTATTGLRGSMTISKIRVYDRVLDPAKIKANFDTESDAFGLIDTDNDSLPTWYERQFSSFLNPNDPSDAAKDHDNDGLTNLKEFQLGTNPDNPDSDGDGVADGAEVNRAAGATNPLQADSDQDGLSDKVETGTGTFVSASDTGSNPLQADSDGDGFADGQEVIHGSNPNSASSTPDFSKPVALVNLDATTLPAGALASWPNAGGLGGLFTAPPGGEGTVETVHGIRGVTLDGVNDYYTGPAAPAFLTGNANRTVEAWLFNPAANTEESVFAWGRRGGPDGSNASFIHGTDPTFGAIGHWGAPDIGWNGPVVTGQWTFVAYTYDGQSLTETVYQDGTAANSETLAAELNTWATDNTPVARPLPFRVGAQNNADASPGGQFASLTIGRIRVYDQALTAAQIAAQYNDEKTFFTSPPAGLKIDNISLNAGAVTLTWVVASGKTYAVETSTNLRDWTALATGLSTGRFSEPVSNATRAKFYRLRVE